jgi:hypothetical protein
MAFTHTWQEMLIVRIFFGYGIGLKGATVAVYSAEVSPTIIRGALGIETHNRNSERVLTPRSDGLAAVDDCWYRTRIR